MYVAPAPGWNELAQRLGTDALMRAITADIPGDDAGYDHWERIQHLPPPAGLSAEEWWLAIAFRRRERARPFGLTDAAGTPFVVGAPDVVLRHLQRVDRECAGRVSMPAPVADSESARDHYLVNARMEEAIRSSQLEGATTARAVAKEMLRTGRAPADRSERMIVNNHRAGEFMRTIAAGRLTPAAVVELQRILTEDTLDDPGGAGRLQHPGEERIAVIDAVDGTVVHTPPPAAQLPERLERLCAFANADDGAEPFLHPVVRSILVHLWLAYDHPFADGNGRTARALFYWSMRVRGYWAAEYLSLSRILREAPAQYARAFLHTETDNLDATYFVVHQLRAIDRAIDDMHAYLRRKAAQLAEVTHDPAIPDGLNHRQSALLAHARRTPGAVYTHTSHARSHDVTIETARTDIMALVEAGLLIRERRGRRHVYLPARDS
ncbi:MAG: Fic family protein [Thermoleophilia bacterium]